MIVYIFDNDGIYTGISATLDENIELQYSGKYTSEEPNGSFVINKWNGNEWVENASIEEVQNKIENDKINSIKQKYEFHKKNGWDAYQNFRAKIILDIFDGTITEPQAFLIEHDLKVSYDRIAQNGDWKTAFYELSQITPSYSFVQPYLTMALNYISNYIQTNYDS